MIPKYSIYLFLFLISACSNPRIDEQYAAKVVKRELSLPGDVSVQKIKGGLSGSQLFLVSNDAKKYVVRFIQHKPRKARTSEIYNLRVAADEDVGPKIYFADPSQGVVIMEYLEGKKVSLQDLQSDQFYIALAHLLQKIHQGQAFESSRHYDPFNRLGQYLRFNQSKYADHLPLAKVEQILDRIHQAIMPYQTTTPCHNDLHGGNLVFLGNDFKAIDYEDAAPGDPYFDIATVAASTSFYSTPQLENILLSAYLGRQPSTKEQAKLYLMKQVVWIKWAIDSLSRLSPEEVPPYEQISAPPISDLAKETLEGTFDLSNPKNNLKHLKVLFSLVFANFESTECKNALTLLTLPK